MAANDLNLGRIQLGVGDVSVKNTTGSAIPIWSCVKFDSANPVGGASNNAFIGVVPTAAVTDVPFGIAVEAIPAGGYGRVQTVDGTIVPVIALGAISAGATIGPSATSGQVTTYTAADPSLGQALEAAVNAADIILCKLAISKNA